MKRHLISLKDYSAAQIEFLVKKSFYLKENSNTLPKLNCHLSLLFNKRSTRTRLAAETSFLPFGASSFLSPADIQLGKNETIRDTAKVISSMSDLILIRWDNKTLFEFCLYSDKPVINGLCEKWHPTQILADLLTVYEKKGTLEELKVAWLGDGNNVCNELLVSLPKMGMEFFVATPEKYSVEKEIIECLSEKELEKVKFVGPKDAVSGADVVITDTWISMHQEAEKEERMRAFKGYKVTKELVKLAKKDYLFMHCLPRKQEEAEDDVFYGENSVVFQEAENRKWSMMSIFHTWLGEDEWDKFNKLK